MLNSNGSNVKTYVGTDGKIHFVDWTGADTALNFSSGISSVIIPEIKLSGKLSAFTSNSSQENCGSSVTNTDNVKITCTGFTSLFIESSTKTVSVTLCKSDGTTSKSNYSAEMDISGCDYIILGIPSSATISSGYRNSTTISYSVTVTNIIIS